jgi:ABC-2 type transport system permease protein
MSLFHHEVRTEQVLFWRSREAAIFTFLLPVLFFVLFGSIYGDSVVSHEDVRAAAFLEAGMIGFAVAATCFAGLAITMVLRRESGVLKRLRATPLPPATYIVAVLASVFVVFLIEAALIVTIGRLFFDVPLPDRPLSLLVTLLLGASVFAALGLAMTALVRSAEGASAVINIVYLPMVMISGTFFSPESTPTVIRAIADVLPLTYFTKLMRDVMLHDQHLWQDAGSVAAVLAWGVAGLVLAVRGFRWQPREG